jgi:glycosyltransferase involved in cell wall biosynthesis
LRLGSGALRLFNCGVNHGKFKHLSPFNILFTITSLEIGGAEKQLVLLAKGLLRRGHRITVFSMQKDGPLRRELETAGCRVISGGLADNDYRKKPWKLLSAVRRLLKTMRCIRPQIVHSFLPFISFFSTVAARCLDVAFIVNSRRSMGNFLDRHPILRPFEYLSNRFCDLIVVNSNTVQLDLMRRSNIAREKIATVYNGIDTSLYHQGCRVDSGISAIGQGIKASDTVITTIASLVSYKGHKDILEAASIVRRKYPDLKYVFVGRDRGMKAALIEMRDRLGLTENVVFTGEKNDIPAVLVASHIAVLASHEEGFSNFILEAMTAGLPVVATNVGGNAEAVEDGETGWLVPPQAPRQLAEKLLDLVENTQRSAQFGKNGKKRVEEKFSVSEMSDAYLVLYANGIKRNPDAAPKL